MSLINFSEFNTLTQCERKWAYQYVLGEEETGARRGLHLGTLCHKWHESWLKGEGGVLCDSWTDDIEPGGKPGEQRTVRLKDFEPELVARALWLRERFVEHYGPEPPSSWTVISAEEWMTREFTWGTLVGRTDGFVEIDGNLWLIELKTYGQRPGPLAYAQVSPQLGCYSLLAEAKHGVRPYGILYQGIYTYRWKQPTMALAAIEEWLFTNPDNVGQSKKDLRTAAKAIQPRMLQPERDTAESFDQLEVELGEGHLRTADRYLAAAVGRRQYLREVGTAQQHTLDECLPNVGKDCSWCSFRPQCWFDLGGVEPFEIEVEDDDAEPV